MIVITTTADYLSNYYKDQFFIDTTNTSRNSFAEHIHTIIYSLFSISDVVDLVIYYYYDFFLLLRLLLLSAIEWDHDCDVGIFAEDLPRIFGIFDKELMAEKKVILFWKKEPRYGKRLDLAMIMRNPQTGEPMGRPKMDIFG